MKVLHLIEALGPGGAEKLLYTNLDRLDPARIESCVGTVFSTNDYWAPAIHDLGVQMFSLQCRGRLDLVRGVRRLAKHLAANPVDLIHTHLWTANIVGRVVGRMLGIPVISSIHLPDYDDSVWDGTIRLGRIKRWIFKALDATTARRCCIALIGVSQYVRESAARHLDYPIENIELLYNPIDLALSSSKAQPSAQTVKAELGLPNDALVALSIGRLTPQKGILFAVQAVAELRDKIPNLHLVVAGSLEDRSYRRMVETAARQLGVTQRLHLLGPRDDVGRLLGACDVFLFPSMAEGLGMALIEALGSGCICIASDTGPIPEVIVHGENGLLIRPGDVGDLARSIERALTDSLLRAKLRSAAQRSTGRFDPDAAAYHLMALYERSGPRGGAASRKPAELSPS